MKDRRGEWRIETDLVYNGIITDKRGEHIQVELYALIDGKEYRVYGYGLKLGQAELANRIIRAWNMKAFGDKLVLRPLVSGTGMWASDVSKVYAPLGRKPNADLKRMGF